MNIDPLVAIHDRHKRAATEHSSRYSPFHFLTIAAVSKSEIIELLESASELSFLRRDSHNAGRAGKGLMRNALAGHSLAAIFEKPSTRTRAAFCTAAFEEGASAQCMGANDIHLGEKESVADTAQVLSQYFSLIAWRGHAHANVEELARSAGVPVVNLLSDMHHPTQALADALTMAQEFGSLAQRKLVFFGDVTNNVARSLCEVGQKLGFGVVLCGPEALLESPLTPRGDGISIDPDPIRAARGAHVLYTDVWTSMGDARTGENKKSAEAMFLPYQVNRRLCLATGIDETIVLHCLPALREREVTSEVLDSSQSRVLLQAENRLHTMKAILLKSLKVD
jgi:ornithine carbamoyltransferase